MTGLLLLLSLLAAPDGGFAPDPWPADGGARVEHKSHLKPGDEEVVKNLDLLEHLDETSDLDLLQELSVER